MRLTPIAIVALSIVLGACSPSDAKFRLADGSSIAKLADPVRPTIVLVYAPSSCFTCSSALHRYRDLARRGKIDLRLVLTTDATAREQLLLSAIHLRPDGVLRAPGFNKEAELLYEGGVLQASSIAPAIGSRSKIIQRVESL